MEGAIQLLLATAVNHSVFSEDKARNISRALLAKMKSRQSSARDPSDWTADLNHVARNYKAAATLVLADRLEAIAIFDEFTKGVVSP